MYTMDHCPDGKKKKDIMKFSGKRRDHEKIILNEATQT